MMAIATRGNAASLNCCFTVQVLLLGSLWTALPGSPLRAASEVLKKRRRIVGTMMASIVSRTDHGPPSSLIQMGTHLAKRSELLVALGHFEARQGLMDRVGLLPAFQR
jgi:hypothetical protein